METVCPICNSTINIIGTESDEIRCSACGSSFVCAEQSMSLVPEGDEYAVTYVPQKSHAASDDVPQLSGYQLIEEIARGGMGVVWKARQKSLNRIVALKLIQSAEFANKDAIARFRAEAEAAAQLDHPGIVPVYEVGEQDGRHFFSMAFVEGGSLSEKVKVGGPLPPTQAAELIKTVAEAVQYGHEKGIIHRDIKPHNILLEPSGSARITDFGLAKRGDSGRTVAGQVMGTPSYMPPEQAQGRQDEIGVVSDVYSLGATLYHILTGRPPFQAATPADTLKQAIEEEPVSPRVLNPVVDRDLETICLKCLEKNRNKRYQSAAELAADLKRFLGGESIMARPVGKWESIWRWCRRKPALAGLWATAVALLLTFAVGGPIIAIVMGAKNAALISSNAKLNQANIDLTDANKAETEAREESDKRARQLLVERLVNEAEQIADSDLTLSLLLASEATDIAHEDDEFDNRSPTAALWKLLFRKTRRQLGKADNTLRSVGFSSTENWLVGSTASRLPTSLFWEITSKDSTITPELPETPGGNIEQVELSSDSQWLAIRFEDDTARLLRIGSDNANGDVSSFELSEDEVKHMAFSPDGRWLAFAKAGGAFRLWDLKRDNPQSQPIDVRPSAPIIKLPGLESIFRLDFSNDGRWLAVTRSKDVFVYKFEEGQLSLNRPIDTGSSFSVAWIPSPRNRITILSPNGEWIVVSSHDPKDPVLLVQLSTEKRSDARIVLGSVTGITFSPDGKWLAAKLNRQTVKLWNLADTDPRKSTFDLNEHQGDINDLLFSPDGNDIITSASDGRVLRWNLSDGSSPKPTPVPGPTAPVMRMTFSDRGEYLAGLTKDGKAIVWRWQPSEQISDPKTLLIPPSADGTQTTILNVNSLTFSPNSDRLACIARTSSGTNSASIRRIWNLREPDGIQGSPLPGHGFPDETVEFTTDGKLMAIHNGRHVAVWTVSEDLKQFERPVHKIYSERQTAVAVSGDGRWLSTGKADGSIRIYELLANNPYQSITEVKGHEEAVRFLAFDTQGTRLYSGGDDQTLKIWSLSRSEHPESLQPLAAYTGLDERITNFFPIDNTKQFIVQFPDRWKSNKRNVIDGNVFEYGEDIPHYAICKPLEAKLSFESLPESVREISLSGNRQTLAVVDSNRLEVWDLAQSSIRKQLLDDLGGDVRNGRLLVSGDGESIALAMKGGGIRVWGLDRSHNLQKHVYLHVNPSKEYRIAFSPDGRRLLAAAKDDPDVYLWNLSEANPDASVLLLSGHEGGVSHIAYSPDGRSIATASKDGIVRLWQPGTARFENGLVVHDDFKASSTSDEVVTHFDPDARMLFSHQGHFLFTVGLRPCVTRVPALDDIPQTQVAMARELAGRRLTSAERRKYMLEPTTNVLKLTK